METQEMMGLNVAKNKSVYFIKLMSEAFNFIP